jgi:hypothetical protein
VRIAQACNATRYLFYLTLFPQAVLSQFSHKTKATDDAIEEAEDTAALDDLDHDPGEDNASDDGEDEVIEDDIDPSVAESDAALIDDVAKKVGIDYPNVSRAEINLGRFAVSKVILISMVR